MQGLKLLIYPKTCMNSMFKCVKFALVSFVGKKNVSFYKVSQTCGEGQLFSRSHADG